MTTCGLQKRHPFPGKRWRQSGQFMTAISGKPSTISGSRSIKGIRNHLHPNYQSVYSEDPHHLTSRHHKRGVSCLGYASALMTGICRRRYQSLPPGAGAGLADEQKHIADKGVFRYTTTYRYHQELICNCPCSDWSAGREAFFRRPVVQESVYNLNQDNIQQDSITRLQKGLN
jgi:hypothetical protein